MAEDGGTYLFKDRLQESEEPAVGGRRLSVYLRVCMPANSVGKRGMHPCSEAGHRCLWEATEWSFAILLCLKTEDRPPHSLVQTCALCLMLP